MSYLRRTSRYQTEDEQKEAFLQMLGDSEGTENTGMLGQTWGEGGQAAREIGFDG